MGRDRRRSKPGCTRACGDPRCGTSTGVWGHLTFGSGALDENGYWSKPCRKCAAEWDYRHAEHVAAVGDRMLADGRTMDEVVEYVSGADWLNMVAWPQAKGD
jgi:hypothetical protein